MVRARSRGSRVPTISSKSSIVRGRTGTHQDAN
jgi:hypothetical protein